MIFGAQPPPLAPSALARQILSEHRFRVGNTSAPPQRAWWDVVLSWVGDRWNELMTAFSTHVRLGSAGTILVGDIVLIAIVAVVVVVLLRLVSNTIADTPLARGAAPLPRKLRAGALYEESLRHASAGEYACAIPLLFRAAIVSLDVRGVIRDRPSLTVNETRTALRAQAVQCIDPFEVLSGVFNDALYAERAVTADQWARARDAYASIAGEA